MAKLNGLFGSLREEPAKEPARATTRTWELKAEDTLTERARKMAEIAFHGIYVDEERTAATAFALAEALEKYAKVDEEAGRAALEDEKQ